MATSTVVVAVVAGAEVVVRVAAACSVDIEF